MSEHEPVVAPLMGPLLEAGFALVQGNLERMRKSLVPALLARIMRERSLRSQKCRVSARWFAVSSDLRH